MKRLLLFLPLIALAGCHASGPLPVVNPTPVPLPTPEPTTFSLYAVRRVAPVDVSPLRCFIGPIGFDAGVQTRDGQTFVPARALAVWLDALTPEPRDFPVLWDFNLRTITVAGHTFGNAVLVNRTGFVACDEAAKVFDLKAEQHGDAVLFEPIATFGGETNADHVYRDPKELLNSNNGKVKP